jgi:hypothetical protein
MKFAERLWVEWQMIGCQSEFSCVALKERHAETRVELGKDGMRM